jgi:threonyl-tRNA synthetase
VKKQAEKLGLRVEIDKTGARLPKQIRNAEIQKIPSCAVVGLKEQESGQLAMRVRKVCHLY